MIRKIVRTTSRVQPLLTDLGLLLMRVSFGGMLLFGHGGGKLRQFVTVGAEGFPDPLGIGPTASMAGAAFAEGVCSALVAVGLLTRLAAVPVVFAMGVAAFVFHANDPFFMSGGAAKEPALIYLTAFASLLLLGPGRFSVDRLLFSR